MSLGGVAPVMDVRSGTSSCSSISKIPGGNLYARPPSAVTVHWMTLDREAVHVPFLIKGPHVMYAYRAAGARLAGGGDSVAWLTAVGIP